MKQYAVARSLAWLILGASLVSSGCVAVGSASNPGGTPISVEQALPGLCAHLDLGCSDALRGTGVTAAPPLLVKPHEN